MIRVGDKVCLILSSQSTRDEGDSTGEVVGMERDRFGLRFLVHWGSYGTTSEAPSALRVVSHEQRRGAK